jgi:acyl-CoA synthetase (AMP-forming)/AMP-acid ligase II
VEAAIVLREGSALTGHELIAWSKDRLAGFKRPRNVVFLKSDEMPRNTTGKILHRVLRDMMSGQAS